MARGRMISATLGGSRKFSRLTSNDARLVYCLLLAHTDAYGRVEADPDYVKGTVLSRVPMTVQDVQAALEDMHEVGLINLYTIDDFQYAQFENFAEHNRTYPSREAQTTIPGPDGNVPQRPPRDDQGESETEPRQDAVTTQSRPWRGKVPENRNKKRKLEVEEDLNPPTPLTDPESPSLDLVEAAPRRELSKPNRITKTARPKDRNAIRPIDQPFVDAWNENRGPLPAVLSLDQGRRRHLDKLRAELGDEALDVFTDATRQIASETFYRQRGYGFTQLLAAGNLLMWAEKWRSSGGMTDADRRLADKAKAVADAIGGLT